MLQLSGVNLISITLGLGVELSAYTYLDSNLFIHFKLSGVYSPLVMVTMTGMPAAASDTSPALGSLQNMIHGGFSIGFGVAE